MGTADKREIKFKAWLLKEKKMVPVDVLANNKGYGGALEIFVDNPNFDPLKKKWEGENRIHDSYLNHSMEVHKERNNGDDFVLLQFTGLKDKNGIDIYEGDLVRRFSKKTKQVEWINGKSMCGWNIGNGYGYKGNTIEIIGNIYQNPELINQTK